MPLDEALGFELSVGIGDGGAVNTENLRKFAAGRNAVTRTEVPSVNEGAELVAQTDPGAMAPLAEGDLPLREADVGVRQWRWAPSIPLRF